MIMNHAVAGLVWGLLVVAAGEAIQAAATRHLRRLGGCALGGLGVAGAAAVFALARRHRQLAASAAAAHESLAHLMTGALALLAALVTVTAYIAVTALASRRARRWPADRW
jgi:hypothetical protein